MYLTNVHQGAKYTEKRRWTDLACHEAFLLQNTLEKKLSLGQYRPDCLCYDSRELGGSGRPRKGGVGILRSFKYFLEAKHPDVGRRSVYG